MYAFTALPDSGVMRDFVSGITVSLHLQRLGRCFLGRRALPSPPPARIASIADCAACGAMRCFAHPDCRGVPAPRNANSGIPFPLAPAPTKPPRAGPAFPPSSAKRMLCTRSRAPRRRAHRPRTAAPARNCGVCGRASQIAHRAVCSGSRRQTAAAMRFGAEGGGGLAVALLSPLLSPPPRSRVPRGMPQGILRQAPHARGPPGRRRFPAALQACRRVVPGSRRRTGSRRRGKSKAHFQAPGSGCLVRLRGASWSC